MPGQRLAFTSLDFVRFKALKHFSVALKDTNLLIGPNNSGKSTVIGAFRALAAGIRRAEARNASPITVDGKTHLGHQIPRESIPISLENVHTDYDDSADSSISFRVSNGNRLVLIFPRDGGCVMTMETASAAPKTPSAFRRAFPVSVGVVPVLGPVEHEEQFVQKETVLRGLATHRASRHFRNYWHYFPDDFDEFAALVEDSWPGMQIERPSLAHMSRILTMFCKENRVPRELYWAGFGFQVWCQLLTHVHRAKNDSLLVIDEPEIYLHPQLQRQLLTILRAAGPDVLIATHSTELISDADASELLLVDKAKRSAKRLRDVKGVQTTLELIGSVQNVELTQLAMNRRVLFTEGPTDWRILRRFARILGLSELNLGQGITAVPSGGFSEWERVRSLAWGIERVLGAGIDIGAVFDRDYRCDEECDAVRTELQNTLSLGHVHQRKELENYMLLPDVLDRAIARAIAEKERRTGENSASRRPAPEILDQITRDQRNDIQGQYIARHAQHFAVSNIDSATHATEAIKRFDSKWQNISTRMEIVHGKNTLRRLREVLQEEHGITLTDFQIIDSFRPGEVPSDLAALIHRLEEFRFKRK